MSYFNFKKRPSKTTDRQKLIRKLDEEFSIYIRLRDADDYGTIYCVTCHEIVHWTDAECGHFVKRRNMATRYHLKNCAGQCRLCNTSDDGKEDLHAEAIDKLYGAGEADKLRRLGKTEVHFSEHELQGMLEELRKEVKALKAEKFDLQR